MQLAAKIIMCFAILSAGTAIAQTIPDPTTAEREHQELLLYRQHAALQASQNAKATPPGSGGAVGNAQGAPVSVAALVAYDKYISAFYDQEIRFRESYLRISDWQIFAANCILGLVMLLSLSGIVFAGFQLWTAAKLAHADNSVDLEISTDSVRLQTSVVGIVVLVISGGFLILFLHDVYRIELVTVGPVVSPPTAASPASEKHGDH